MKRWACLVSLIALDVLTSFAQTHEIESRVLDSVTGAPVPFVTVRVVGGGSTIANESGWFTVEASLGDTLQITSVGYDHVSITAGEIGHAVML